MTDQAILQLLHREVVPAIGCTEPIAVALCVAKATELLGKRPQAICVEMSKNIYKNAMAVGIPNTGMTGLPISIALGATVGKSAYQLEVLRDTTPEAVLEAKRYMAEVPAEIVVDPAAPDVLYIHATVRADGREAEATIMGDHTHFTDPKHPTKVCPPPPESPECPESPERPESPAAMPSPESPERPPESPAAMPSPESPERPPESPEHPESPEPPESPAAMPSPESPERPEHPECPEPPEHPEHLELTLREVYDYAVSVPLTDVLFLLEGAKMNVAAAECSFANNYGHGLGRMLHSGQFASVFGDTLFTKILSYTSGACDARMAGAMVPVMSNSGSGNQGISCSVPVLMYAREHNNTEEETLRALTLSNLTEIYIKQSLGRLSALCGCVVASTGSAVGITYLMGGRYDEVTFAIKNMIANISGMLCDGAKPGCSLKVTSGVATAVLSASLAMQHSYAAADEGIVEEDVDRTIHNLTRIGKQGMLQTDDLILDIMTHKQ